MKHLFCIDIDQDLDGVESSQMRRRYSILGGPFVYASFLQPYKIDPELFATWMEILSQVLNSLLLLLRHSETMEVSLGEEASKHPIASDGIVFLALVPRDEHLARCRVVDVFLDARVCRGIATS